MKGKRLFSVVLALALVVSLVAVGCAKAPSPSEQPEAPALSEQPDKAIFNRYFSEMGLGRLPLGGKFPMDLQRNVAIFAPGDQISLYGTIIEECQPRYKIYDVQAKQVVREGGMPQPLMKGGFAGAESLDIPAGKYEYKVYVGDALAAVFPFEVK